MRALLLVLGACAASPTYLGTEVPKPCTSRDAEGCLGWMLERDLLAAELAIYDDARLRAYVQRVAARLARVSTLTATPRVMIADHDETYATAGRRIVIARTTIEKLETEAELAGILAHEIAHIEARHVMVSLFGRPESDSPAHRRDAEAIADERAVALLERAGYAPTAMATALAAVLADDDAAADASADAAADASADAADDADHPPRLARIARVAQLAGDRTGFVGRAELLAHLDGMVVGRDPRLGQLVGDAWILPALGVAIDITDDDRVLSADAVFVVRRPDRSTLLAYAVGTPWARELTTRLDEPEVTRSALGRVTRGTMTGPAADDSPLGRLARAIRATLPQPAAGTRVTLVARPRGSLVIEHGRSNPPLLALRAARPIELAATRPTRIVIERAARAGHAGPLCTHSSLERDPDRHVEPGAPIKCLTKRAANRHGN